MGLSWAANEGRDGNKARVFCMLMHVLRLQSKAPKVALLARLGKVVVLFAGPPFFAASCFQGPQSLSSRYLQH